MENDEPLDNTESLTRPRTKKDRSPAQVAAFEAMRAKLNAKHSGSKALDPTKKAVLAMVKDKLNGPPKSTEPLPESSDEEEVAPPPKKVKAPKVVEAPPKPPKKKQPVVQEIEESESEEEVIIVKKKKKPKKKTIIYEESSDEEEEEPAPPPPKKEARETKTQQNKASRFKVSVPESKPTGPVYYFA